MLQIDLFVLQEMEGHWDCEGKMAKLQAEMQGMQGFVVNIRGTRPQSSNSFNVIFDTEHLWTSSWRPIQFLTVVCS